MFWRAAGNEERDIADGSAPSGAARIASRRRRLRSKNQLKLIQFRGFGRGGSRDGPDGSARPLAERGLWTQNDSCTLRREGASDRALAGRDVARAAERRA